MRAIVLTGHGGLDKLEYRTDWPAPEIGEGEVLIRVLACGLNNTDVNTRAGWYSKAVREGTTGEGQIDESEDGAWGSGIQFPRIQGADVCGRVEAVGEGADPALVGRRVLIDTWVRDWTDPTNMDKAKYFGSELDGGYAEFTQGAAPECPPYRQRPDRRRTRHLRHVLCDGGEYAGPGECGRWATASSSPAPQAALAGR